VQFGGATLLGLAALAWLAIAGVEGALVMGVLSTSACVIGGIAIFARGSQMVVQSMRRLHALREMRKLPVAKIRALGPGR
jgi:hypothetical protein